uniref:Uncharacterized protein n=1 Tax=Panagrolaimus sp. JU765 TaxID=591449 RepID=A0AC34RQJ7_9BILA
MTDKCYYVQDPATLKTIDGGCDFYVGDKPKCSGDGCNYPMSCYDPATDSVIQCGDKVRTCQVVYEKDDKNDVKNVTSGCGIQNDPALSPSVNETVCQMNGTDTKQCVCTGDMCNYPPNFASVFCYNDTSSDTVIKCPMDTTHCYFSVDTTTGEMIKKGCSIFHVENKCSVENNVRTCVCEGNKCNVRECFIFNGTMPAKLEICPYETGECYIARDLRTLKLIEAGCYRQNLGDYKIQKCHQNGCNYPMYCHDYKLNDTVQCGANVTSCFVDFDDRHESSPQNIPCEMNGTGGKNCVCSGDMCNHERNFDSVSCFSSNDTGFEMLTKCPMDTTHCYSLWDKNNGIRMGCSVFDQKEGCRMEDNKKICVCQGDGCNQDILNVKCFVSNATTPAELENDTKICICEGDVCNQDILNVKCFVSNVTAPAKLETCPYEALECYSIRDPESLKSIETGCGVSQNKNAEMCSENGCNYPHHCYDSQTNGTQQCARDVTTCYTIFEGDNHQNTMISGCDGSVVNLPTPANGTECKLEGSKRYCSCSADMCNYEKNFELTRCAISDGKHKDITAICSVFLTHCFYKRDVNTERIIQKNCLIFEETGEGCVVQDDVETCKCVGDGCNNEILLDTSLPFAKLYRYAVYPHLA